MTNEEQFVIHTIQLIKNSNIIHKGTTIRDVTYYNNTRHNIAIVHTDSFGSPANIAGNIILQNIVMFSILDAHIDFKYPNFQGDSFAVKYRKLPDTDDLEIITKEIYRIFKLIRNASVHSMNSVTTTKQDVNVNYQFKQTNFKLEISKEGISILNGLLLRLISPLNKLTQSHHMHICRSMYKELSKEITCFQDDRGTGLKGISYSPLKLMWRQREYIKNPNYEVVIDTILFKTIYELTEYEIEAVGVDYLIEVDSQKYLIPAEIIHNNQIKIDDIYIWKLDVNNS
ncbi:hypothetical protein CN906_20710 [Bacillus toyonensis]|uniref:hypothetical protein n=1 Tax=Bacillus toyonensis TaxID=155322 RepID=UPI000BF24064|nr:hypothetical protein [Bacillus toyonensis]PEJ62420.1 hypothetical protein CN906_20710 [Bacillus toyonensis]PGB31892.1 hypothetical protein COM16_17180 [Bacillus toyonensis]PHG54331.1 hypothetical protein COI57_01630 [Bacillus toyonensis]